MKYISKLLFTSMFLIQLNILNCFNPSNNFHIDFNGRIYYLQNCTQSYQEVQKHISTCDICKEIINNSKKFNIQLCSEVAQTPEAPTKTVDLINGNN